MRYVTVYGRGYTRERPIYWVYMNPDHADENLKGLCKELVQFYDKNLTVMLTFGKAYIFESDVYIDGMSTECYVFNSSFEYVGMA